MLNPITYTEQVVSDFLRYQLSTYAFADAGDNERLLPLVQHDAGLPVDDFRDPPKRRRINFRLQPTGRVTRCHHACASQNCFSS